MSTLYYRVEEALLHDYFGIPRPANLRDINIWDKNFLWFLFRKFPNDAA